MYENEIKQWALAQKVAYLPCPRCGGKMHENLMHNSLSRHAEIHVCPVCGMDEAYRDFNDKGSGDLAIPVKDWFVIKNVFTPNRFTYDEALKGTFIETHHSVFVPDEQLCEIAEMIIPGWESEWFDNAWADDADLDRYEDIKRVIYSGTPIYIHDSVSDTTVQFTKQDLLNGILKWIEEGEQADDYMVVHAPDATSKIRFSRIVNQNDPNIVLDLISDFHADRILQYAIFGEIKYEALKENTIMNNKKIKIFPSIGDAFTVDLPDNICNAEDFESAIEVWLEDTFSFVESWEFASVHKENKRKAPEDTFQHTGIIRRIDDLGRIFIPKEIRRKLTLLENDPMEYMIYGQCIVMRKYHPGDKISAYLETLKNVVTEENLERKDQILRLIDNISEIL